MCYLADLAITRNIHIYTGLAQLEIAGFGITLSMPCDIHAHAHTGFCL